jgi:hypothetical protein
MSRDSCERCPELTYHRLHNLQLDQGFLAQTESECALVAMVDAWATDTAAGHDTLMLAWRRASVADLNGLARVRAEQLGWLTGQDLVTRDGRGYTVGDLIVTLAPNPRGELVTSQRGRVAAIDQQAQTLTMHTDDGRRVVLTGAAIDKDHLDHGYALAVHREQGETAVRTRYLVEGGGRELAYVAMSRARGPSIVRRRRQPRPSHRGHHLRLVARAQPAMDQPHRANRHRPGPSSAAHRSHRRAGTARRRAGRTGPVRPAQRSR